MCECAGVLMCDLCAVRSLQYPLIASSLNRCCTSNSRHVTTDNSCALEGREKGGRREGEGREKRKGEELLVSH